MLDNAPSHPTYLNEINENVKFMFMPPNTMAIIQPMDQGVISTFKVCYLRQRYAQILKDDENAENLKCLWKNFNILNAVQNIEKAWKTVTDHCMKGVWRQLIPSLLEVITNPASNERCSVINEIVEKAIEVGFEGLERSDLEEVLNFHDYELTNEDLLEKLNEENELNAENENECQMDTEVSKKLTKKHLFKAFALIDEVIEIFTENDCDETRSWTVRQQINESITSYKTMLSEMQKGSSQSTLDCFFSKNQNQN